jgi:hypothetical protein
MEVGERDRTRAEQAMIPFIAFVILTTVSLWSLNRLFKALSDFDD